MSTCFSGLWSWFRLRRGNSPTSEVVDSGKSPDVELPNLSFTEAELLSPDLLFIRLVNEYLRFIHHGGQQTAEMIRRSLVGSESRADINRQIIEAQRRRGRKAVEMFDNGGSVENFLVELKATIVLPLNFKSVKGNPLRDSLFEMSWTWVCDQVESIFFQLEQRPILFLGDDSSSAFYTHSKGEDVPREVILTTMRAWELVNRDDLPVPLDPYDLNGGPRAAWLGNSSIGQLLAHTRRFSSNEISEAIARNVSGLIGSAQVLVVKHGSDKVAIDIHGKVHSFRGCVDLDNLPLGIYETAPHREGWIQLFPSPGLSKGALWLSSEVYSALQTARNTPRGSVLITPPTMRDDFSLHGQHGYPRFSWKINKSEVGKESFELPVETFKDDDGGLFRHLKALKLLADARLDEVEGLIPESAWWVDCHLGETRGKKRHKLCNGAEGGGKKAALIAVSYNNKFLRRDDQPYWSKDTRVPRLGVRMLWQTTLSGKGGETSYVVALVDEGETLVLHPMYGIYFDPETNEVKVLSGDVELTGECNPSITEAM